MCLSIVKCPSPKSLQAKGLTRDTRDSYGGKVPVPPSSVSLVHPPLAAPVRVTGELPTGQGANREFQNFLYQ